MTSLMLRVIDYQQEQISPIAKIPEILVSNFSSTSMWPISVLIIPNDSIPKLNKMPPYEGGGDMIEIVTFEKSTYREAPTKFEAGTPPIVEAVGLLQNT